MGNGDNGRCVFPLTSLQIGDLQSYLSHLSLFLATQSNKFYILVDNRPWLEGLGSRPAFLWQLMVTKSRLSPFANTRAKKGRKDAKENVATKTNAKRNSKKQRKSDNKSKISERWFSLIEAAALSQKRALLPVKKLKYSLQFNHELHRTLFGLIVFEVAWDNVRGINYLNELQSNTSLTIETKYMKRWEFDSIMQAVGCMSSWFSGTHKEQSLLREYLLSIVDDVFYDALDDFPDEQSVCYYDVGIDDESSYGLTTSFSVYPATTENDPSILHTPPPPDIPYKRRKINAYTEETPNGSIPDPLEHFENAVEPTEHKDVLILFRFNDRDLPFKLREIIMSDLRLLTLLESGLPSWVIFLQSYPVFCHLYRPWMCPLARALYMIISIVTVVIGFYDLYKNVPLLKATASHLLGPLFDWIETWDMVSRIKYLGTMLFLHNFEKAVQWFIMITRTVRSFVSVLAQPMVGPLTEIFDFLLPFWNTCAQVVQSIGSVMWLALGSSCNLVANMVEILLLPFWFIFSFIWITATSIIYPILWVIREILYAPVRLILAVSSLVTSTCTLVYETLVDLWVLMRSILSVASATEATVTTYEASMWRSLWNDMFSQVFKAVRSILNGFVAFFTACNRHRLSIYNHIKEFIRRVRRREGASTAHIDPRHRRKHVDPHLRRRPTCRSPNSQGGNGEFMATVNR